MYFSHNQHLAVSSGVTVELLADHIAAAAEPSQQQLLHQLTHRFSYQAALWSQHNRSRFSQQLNSLVVDYVGYLPILLREFKCQCDAIGWERVAEETDTILLLFFAQRKNHVAEDGIMALLDKIYFGHRLIEELHDHLLQFSVAPLLNWNMTTANLLIHQLLGEEYSAKLDQTAIELATKVINEAPRPTIRTIHKRQSQRDSWPCFCARYGLALNLTG